MWRIEGTVRAKSCVKMAQLNVSVLLNAVYIEGDFSMNYFIASCGYTTQFPEQSRRIREYIADAYPNIEIVRCCVPGWKTKIYEDKMPTGELVDAWRAMPQSRVLTAEDAIWSLCPNCMNIAAEWRGAEAHALWELIDADADFPLPNLNGWHVTLQDCWRMREYTATHDAVRSLLTKMGITWEEIPNNREKADFCGKTLYRPQVDRNPQLAPKHYRDNAVGLFEPHTEEEQDRLMRAYCAQYGSDAVICYCHYCLEGLRVGASRAYHIADLIFGNVDAMKKGCCTRFSYSSPH